MSLSSLYVLAFFTSAIDVAPSPVGQRHVCGAVEFNLSFNDTSSCREHMYVTPHTHTHTVAVLVVHRGRLLQ